MFLALNFNKPQTSLLNVTTPLALPQISTLAKMDAITQAILNRSKLEVEHIKISQPTAE